MAAQSRDGARETDQGSTCWDRAPGCSGTRAPADGGDRACCSDSGRPHNQMFFLCLCWPGPEGPQTVWPRAPQVRRMRSSCQAACRGEREADPLLWQRRSPDRWREEKLFPLTRSWMEEVKMKTKRDAIPREAPHAQGSGCWLDPGRGGGSLLAENCHPDEGQQRPPPR